jgi:hypothetical protein
MKHEITLTRNYSGSGYVCSNMMQVRSAAFCGDRRLIITSYLSFREVIRELRELGYRVHLA